VPVNQEGTLSHVLRRALLATAAVAALVGFIATFAYAAAKPPQKPQITFAGDPTSDGGLLVGGAIGFS